MTTLISFYTKDWQYPQHAKRLAAECDALSMPHVIEELPSTGSYLKNTCLKPQFILDKLRELKSPVLWVDVDASLLKKPVLFESDEFYYTCVMGDGVKVCRTAQDVLRLLDKYPDVESRPIVVANDFAARRMSKERSRTWHVGTMWFNYTPTMIEFLERWIENTGNISDESALEKTWQQFGATINTVDLPPEYFHIIRTGKPVPEGTVVAHRISTGESKRREMPAAIARAKRGEW